MDNVTTMPEPDSFEWAGLKFKRRGAEYHCERGAFEWEVDARPSPVADHATPEHFARVYLRGVKLIMSTGKTRFAALSDALEKLKTLEALVSTEIHERRQGKQRPSTRR
jgi:hypothetical protein